MLVNSLTLKSDCNKNQFYCVNKIQNKILESFTLKDREAAHQLSEIFRYLIYDLAIDDNSQFSIGAGLENSKIKIGYCE